MICNNCQATVGEKDNFCKGCGASVGVSEPIVNIQSESGKIHKKKKHPLLITVGILLALALIIAIGVNNEKTATDLQIKFKGFTSEQESNALRVLADCGVVNIKNVTHDELLDRDDLKGYRLNTEYDNVGEVIVYVDHEKIRQVKFLGEYLYKNQEITSQATDHFLTTGQQSDYQIKCKELVKGILKAPSTAKFPIISDWSIWKQEGEVIVQSYVDSQNSFGAMIRSEFQFKIKDGEITSFIFDGQEHISNK